MLKKKSRTKSKAPQLENAINAVTKACKKSRVHGKTSKKQEGFDLAFDAITDPVIMFDVEFNITKINKSGRQFFKGNPVGKKCFFTEHKFTSACKDCPTWQTIKTCATATGEILNPKTGDPLLLKTYPLYNKQKKLTGVVLVGRDSNDVPIKWMR